MDNVRYFAELLGSCHNLYLWSYDGAMELSYSNCPDWDGMEALVGLGEMKERLVSYAKEGRVPILITNAVTFLWIAQPVREENRFSGVHILGPLFMDEGSRRTVEQHLKSLQLTPGFKAEVSRFIRSLPIISLNRIFEYAIMLHYAVTGEKIEVSDLNYETNPDALRREESAFSEERIIHGTYEAEREMLRKVREGDMSFVDEISQMTTMGSLGRLTNDSSIRQYKNAVLVCVTLFSRAAIEGGLSPELSMTLTDRYFQDIEAAETVAELADVSVTMQKDFVERVHKAKARSHFSKAVQQSMNYIDLHLEEPISLGDIAAEAGYTDYYLSKKFSAEAGESIKAYIGKKRLERAAFLLEATDISLHDISEKLHYNSQSYFTEQFRRYFGISPAKFREERRHS